jgi:lipopolysaccharide export system protein LptA
MSTRAVLSRCSLAATLLLIPVAALALPEDSSQPINIQSDRASQVSLAAGEKTEYFGNVVITQGSMKINGDHIVIHSHERRVTSIIATGKPAQFEQQSDPGKAPIKAQANTLDYRLNNDTVVLTENAYIEQDGTTVSGNQIEYNIGSEQVRASGNKENSSRVKMVLIPEQKQNKDSSPAPEPATAPTLSQPQSSDN